MRAAGQSESAIRSFISALERVQAGDATLIPSSSLEPAPDVPLLQDLPAVDGGSALQRVVVIRLNGGLATSMGLQQPKSLLEAREGHTFLDLIVGQILSLRRAHGVRLPLVLMNSEVTREPALAALREHPQIETSGLAPDFLQSMVPKLDQQTLLPARWPAAPALEWCPPGHGDVYASLIGSGMLDSLLAQGFRYAMIANSDNLGAVADPRIAAHLAAERIPFLMEVVRGTAAERKGGHIALRVDDGQLILRETAQTPPEDEESFRDYRRWRYYNTNSLWLDLAVLAARFADGGTLELPVIANRKTIDPRDPDSTPVLQLESAMGAAIGSFPGARVLEVPRTRFVPVKTTDDLLLLRSDAYQLTDELAIEPAGEGGGLPFVALDRRHFGLIDEFDRRFPAGPPSLCRAERFIVSGDVSFGSGVVIQGEVELEAGSGPCHIPDNTVLDARGAQDALAQ
jgi:UTP--glucose-1-phosphate uridylyltransferase